MGLKKIKLYSLQKIQNLFVKIIPNLYGLIIYEIGWSGIRNICIKSTINNLVFIGDNHKIVNSEIGSYTSIAANCNISFTKIGKFCSIGPNFISGFGIHPTNGISTSALFYSKVHATGETFSKENKIIERKNIEIGNDVWIGANCFILDGCKIGNGAVIAAGSIVVKDVPDYAIVGGVPAKIIRYRFTEDQIKNLLIISWWDLPKEKLQDVEKYFFDIETFIKKYR